MCNMVGIGENFQSVMIYIFGTSSFLLKTRVAKFCRKILCIQMQIWELTKIKHANYYLERN